MLRLKALAVSSYFTSARVRPAHSRQAGPITGLWSLSSDALDLHPDKMLLQTATVAISEQIKRSPEEKP